jgi:hypothetical protein
MKVDLLSLPVGLLEAREVDLRAHLVEMSARTRGAYYAEAVSSLQSPMASIAYWTIRDCKCLRSRLNTVIVLAKVFFLGGLLLAILSIFYSWWLFIPFGAVALVWYFVLNPLQTATNFRVCLSIDLAMGMLLTDSASRAHAIEIIREKYGTEAASEAESLLAEATGPSEESPTLGV